MKCTNKPRWCSSPEGVHGTSADTSGEKKTSLSRQTAELLKIGPESPTSAGTATLQKADAIPDTSLVQSFDPFTRPKHAGLYTSLDYPLFGSEREETTTSPTLGNWFDCVRKLKAREETTGSSARGEPLIKYVGKYHDEKHPHIHCTCRCHHYDATLKLELLRSQRQQSKMQASLWESHQSIAHDGKRPWLTGREETEESSAEAELVMVSSGENSGGEQQRLKIGIVKSTRNTAGLKLLKKKSLGKERKTAKLQSGTVAKDYDEKHQELKESETAGSSARAEPLIGYVGEYYDEKHPCSHCACGRRHSNGVLQEDLRRCQRQLSNMQDLLRKRNMLKGKEQTAGAEMKVPASFQSRFELPTYVDVSECSGISSPLSPSPSCIAEPLGQDGTPPVSQGMTSCAGQTLKHSGSGLSVLSESSLDGSCELPGQTATFPAYTSPPARQGSAGHDPTEAEKDQQQMFTPCITDDFDDETYRFLFFGPGLFQSDSRSTADRRPKTCSFAKKHKVEDSFDCLSFQSYDLLEGEESAAAVKHPVTHTLLTQSDVHAHSADPALSCGGNVHSSPSLSFPSQTQTSSSKIQNFTRALSLPAMKLNSSYEEFTPDFIEGESAETYRFLFSGPGLFQCRVTGLVFHMEGEGDVLYRIVPWDRRRLSQHHKKPAGPLFDITCQQKSMCQLHLPHCEILSTGGGNFLSVAHVNDEGIKFITPHKITESHVIINITGFSGFGNVKDEDSPPDPVRALVLLFYRPTDDPEHLINVLMLPKNVSLRDVQRTRKKLVGDETYIETSPHCKLQPKQDYTLSTCPGADSVLVQPAEAQFDEESYDNYFPSFQLTYETAMKHMKLFLRDSSSHSVWERRVCLSTSGVKRSCGSTAVNLRPHEQLLEIRSHFIHGVSEPVLQSLLDKLLETKVMTDSEREAAEEMRSRGDKARCVLDTVRKKGEAAGSEMIQFLREVDPFLCEHLGLM